MTTATDKDLEKLVSSLTPSMRDGLKRAYHGHRPPKNTLNALLNRKLVERALVDGKMVRRLTALGLQVHARLMCEKPSRIMAKNWRQESIFSKFSES